MTERAGVTLFVLGLVLLLAALLRFAAASGGFDWPDDATFWELRARRVVSGAVVGAALAASGALLQSMLRNPLASPFILGLTSGAGLGVIIATYAAYLATGAIVTFRLPLAPAVIGAFAALGLVYLLGQRRGLVDPASLILVGVIVSIVCGALGAFVQHLLPDRGMAVYTRWVMGSISDEATWSQIALVGGVTLAGLLVSIALGRALDAAALSDDEAVSVGVRLGALRLVVLGVAGVLTAGTIVLAGPIGFVGLICPHFVRLLAGPAHRPLLAGAALAGAALIVLADVAVAMIDLSTGRIPIGVLTTLLGGPVFIVLLRRSAAS